MVDLELFDWIFMFLGLGERQADFREDFYVHFGEYSAADLITEVGLVYDLHEIFLDSAGYFLVVVFSHAAAVKLLVDEIQS